jgi:hypothetical protein
MTWSQSSLRKFILNNDTTPSRVGPGSYNTTSSLLKKAKTRRSQTFSSAQRDIFPRQELVTPGPGFYSSAHAFTPLNNRSESSFFQSRTARDIFKSSNSDFPSSANYAQLEEWGKVKVARPPPNRPKRKKYIPYVRETMNFLDDNGRLVVKNVKPVTEEDIGPGRYNPNDDETTRVHEINRTKRDLDIFNTANNTTPVPTRYTIPEVDTRIPRKIGEILKEKEPDICHELGDPFTYEPPRGQTASFKSRTSRDFFTDCENDVPGPGTYFKSILPEKKKPNLYGDTGVIFGTRSVRFNKNTSDTPAPNTYNPHNEVRRSDGPASVLKNRAKVPELFSCNDVVGPGTYNILRKSMKPQLSPAFADGEQRLPDYDKGFPGPADYSPQWEEEKAASIFFTRYENVGNWAYNQYSDNPSPQDYNVLTPFTDGKRGITISRTQRFRKGSKEKFPGPGDYDTSQPFIKPSFNSAVPRFN